ncbi:MAG: GIY-YIG nuclease family protein [Bacteroidetes bacterium]|nr:GIY-YIG nuclease family protein [Bacteroidota bacterium]
MKYFVYIIQSEKDKSFYIGSTKNINLRIERHNQGWSRYTKTKTPWKIVYSEEFENKSEAIKREINIKKMKSRVYIENLIKETRSRPD